jgi:hypothetical protein
MDIHEGYVRSWFTDRKFGWLRNHTSKVDSFFHLSDCNIPPAKLIVGANVRYTLTEYVQKGQTRTKAINIELSLPMPEQEYVEAAPVNSVLVVQEPIIKPVVATSAPNPTAGRAIAAKSLSFNHTVAKRAPTPRAKAILSGDEQNVRPRGSQKLSPDDKGGE